MNTLYKVVFHGFVYFLFEEFGSLLG